MVMAEVERASAAKLSNVALGKQKQASIMLPTITVFLPKSLRKGLTQSPESNLLLGWWFWAGPLEDKIIIVVAGLVSRRQVVQSRIKHADNLESENSKARIVGSCRSQQDEQVQSRTKEETMNKNDAIWLEVVMPKSQTLSGQNESLRLPMIASVRAPIVYSSLQQCAINVILYRIPRAERMKYLSLEPMILPKASSAGVLDQSSEGPYQARNQHLQHGLEALIRLDPLRFQELSCQYPPDRGPGQGFRRAVELLNQCGYLNETIDSNFISKGNDRRKIQSSSSLSILFSSFRFARSCCQHMSTLMRVSAGGIALCDFSATARQLDLRLGQFIVWPSLGYQLRKQRRRDREPVSKLAPRYIALYNGVWLVMNDVILGQAAGVWICDNNAAIARFIARTLLPVLADGLIDTLEWLDNWPAGLKLNTQLSHFFRDMFVGLTFVWRDVILSSLAKDDLILQQVVYLTGLASRTMGLTMLLSITVDALSLLTLHWTIFYRIQQAIYSFFCSSIVSLFHLFRGKKRNPLRKNRTDKATYELDQLLLGTIFFTLFVFLWLTVAVYYLQFSLLRIAIVGVITVLQTGLALLNHLPLFALMLRIKESDRLPGGVELQFHQVDPALNPLCCCYFELHNTPLRMQDIFRGYNGHLQSVRELPHLLWSLIKGRKF